MRYQNECVPFRYKTFNIVTQYQMVHHEAIQLYFLDSQCPAKSKFHLSFLVNA